MRAKGEGLERPLADAERSLAARAAVPAAIFFVVVLVGLSYVSRPAWVYDETYYFPFSEAVGKWVSAPTLDEAAVEAAFREGNAHPPLPLYAMAATTALFRGERGEFLFAMRMATVLQFAALVVVVYLFVKREAGLAAAAFAAALTALSPRLFAHSLMGTYDVGMCLWWVATTIAFVRGMKSRGWAVGCGFIFGLALLTKVNAFLLPVALWPWGIYFHGKRSLGAILWMSVAGPAVFFAGWPWLWLNPLGNTAEYIIDKFPGGMLPGFVHSLTETREIPWRGPSPTLYFGRADAGGVPWHYSFVMTVMTMPVAALAGSVSSAVCARRDGGRRGLIVLLWWSVLVQLVVFAFVMKPFDGVRLFLPVVALVAMCGGLGLSWLVRRGKGWLVAAVVVTVVSPGVEFFVYEPYGMSYFSPVVGGLPGAEALGMEVSYYGEAVDRGSFDAINARAKPGESVAYGPFLEKIPEWMPREYMRYGYLDGKLAAADSAGDWDYLIFINRGGCVDETDRETIARGEVIHENRLLGVVLAKVLARREESEGGDDAHGRP